MQILQSWTARTLLAMSNVARAQQGLGSEQLTVNSKSEHLPIHDFHIGQSVMYLNPVNSKMVFKPQSLAYAKNLDVTRSEQMMVSFIEKHRTTWNCTKEMKKKWTIIIHKH